MVQDVHNRPQTARDVQEGLVTSVQSPGVAALRRVLADFDRRKHQFWRSAVCAKCVESHVCLQDPARCRVSAEASLASHFRLQSSRSRHRFSRSFAEVTYATLLRAEQRSSISPCARKQMPEPSQEDAGIVMNIVADAAAEAADVSGAEQVLFQFRPGAQFQVVRHPAVGWGTYWSAWRTPALKAFHSGGSAKRFIPSNWTARPTGTTW